MNNAKPITIYTTAICPFCHRAKSLLKKKGVEFEEIDVSFSIEKREEMRLRANGGHTVPQIFIGEQHVGGCDDLYALESQQKLDAILFD